MSNLHDITQQYGTEIVVLCVVVLFIGVAMVFMRPSRPGKVSPTFELEIRQGSVRVVSGSPPAGFVQACTDIVSRNRLQAGWIAEQPMGESARLALSSDIPEQYHQAFRNAWTPPTSPGDGSASRA